ncbi:DUF2919 domain-containing protein [Enterobacteriaceae bacterium BIT-l23]|uniref:DUF2919 domain-containing protein n=1 Tax=Jejubacter sp. L23 TaxID=3092086 RepID=UPI001584EB30|nr:DUF2919 domain-containing protein [Enterobacteriaceae bacterium BIT-l23]
MWEASDYNSQGWLRLPPLFWVVLVLQARTWVLLVLAGASRQQGETLLALFYPDRTAFWLGLLAGIPAALAFLLSGRRHRFVRLWRGWRWVLIVAQLALSLWQLWMLAQGEAETVTALALLIVDLLALWWLLVSHRLRACFEQDGTFT